MTATSTSCARPGGMRTAGSNSSTPAVGALDDALRARGGGLMITHGRAADSVVDLWRGG